MTFLNCPFWVNVRSQKCVLFFSVHLVLSHLLALPLSRPPFKCCSNCLNPDELFVMATPTVSVFEQIQIACRPRASGSKFVAQYAAQITARARLLVRIPRWWPQERSMVITPSSAAVFLFVCSV